MKQNNHIASLQFMRWFSDSKVVDADGKPLVVYHGTNVDIYVFNTCAVNDTDRKRIGAYFTTNSRFAGMYGGTIMPLYLSIKKPFDITGMDAREALESLPVSEMLKRELRSTFRGPGNWNYGVLESAQRENLRETLEGSGYDGVKYTEGYADAYIAFCPSQIKSAIGNSGNFDPRNQSIIA